MRVLIVDDAEDIREAFRALLAAVGHETTVAEDGEMALRMVAQQMPDLVLTDIMMPGLSGLDLIIRLRSDFLRPPRIIAFSGFPNMESQALEAGADLFLEKPVEPTDLIECVERLLAGEAAETARARLHSEARRHHITLEAERILGTLTADREAVARLRFVPGWLGKLLDGDCVVILIKDELPYLAAVSEPERLRGRSVHDALLRAARDVLQGGSLLVIDSAFTRAAFGLDGLHLLAHPLRLFSEPVGVLCVIREQPRGFDTVDVRIVELVARAGSHGISMRGERLLSQPGLLTVRAFEDLLGLLTRRSSQSCPFLMALVRTRQVIQVDGDDSPFDTHTTVGELGPRELGILLSGQKDPHAGLRELLDQIKARWGLDGTVAAVYHVPMARIPGSTLIDHLRDLLDQEEAGRILWVEQTAHPE